MEHTFEITDKIRGRDLYYYRHRYKNRVAGKLLSFFEEEAKRTGVSKKTIADKLSKSPSQISRWLTHPSNLTLETISDILLALGAEAEPPPIVRFSDRTERNYAHPVVARFLGRHVAPPANPGPVPDKSAPIKWESDLNAKLAVGTLV